MTLNDDKRPNLDKLNKKLIVDNFLKPLRKMQIKGVSSIVIHNLI